MVKVEVKEEEEDEEDVSVQADARRGVRRMQQQSDLGFQAS